MSNRCVNSWNQGSKFRYLVSIWPLFVTLLLLVGTLCGNVFAQTRIAFPGAISNVTFETQAQFDAANNADATWDTPYVPYKIEDSNAITHIVNYLNDVIETPVGGFNGDVQMARRNMIAIGRPGAAAFGGLGGITVGDSYFADPANLYNTQLKQTTFNSIVLHEFAHVLHISGFAPGIYTEHVVDGQQSVMFDTPSSSTFGQYMRDSNGDLIQLGVAYVLDQDRPFKYFGPASEIYGDFWLTSQAEGIATDSRHDSIGLFDHPYDPPAGNMTYRGYARPFYSEVELGLLQDLGHTIQMNRFFGRSLYQIHADPIANDTAFNGDGMYGVGLHLVYSDDQGDNPAAAGNTVIQQADLISTGKYGAGIRVEGYNHDITIDNGVTVAGNGEEGIGVVITVMDSGYGSSGTKLANNGTINATGLNGTGVYFNANSAVFNNAGTIIAQQADGTLNDAIHIASGVTVSAINFLEGTVIVGNIVSESTSVHTVNITGTTKLGGNVDIGAGGQVVVAETGSLQAGVTTTGNLGLLNFVSGNLAMLDDSTLTVDIGANNTSDTIVLTGGAEIGAIDIALSDLVEGSFTLIDAGTSLTYNDNATVSFGGQTLTSGEEFGHWRSVIFDVVGDTTSDYNLTLNITSLLPAGNLDGIRWTGTTDNTWDTITFNWDSQDQTFKNGDAIIFDLDDGDPLTTTVHNITIADPDGVTVADMTIEGSDDWSFVGDISGSTDSSDTTLATTTGSLLQTGPGALTLDGNYQFENVTFGDGNNVLAADSTMNSSTDITFGNGNNTVGANVELNTTAGAITFGTGDDFVDENAVLNAFTNITFGDGNNTVMNGTELNAATGAITFGIGDDSVGNNAQLTAATGIAFGDGVTIVGNNANLTATATTASITFGSGNDVVGDNAVLNASANIVLGDGSNRIGVAAELTTARFNITFGDGNNIIENGAVLTARRNITFGNGDNIIYDDAKLTTTTEDIVFGDGNNNIYSDVTLSSGRNITFGDGYNQIMSNASLTSVGDITFGSTAASMATLNPGSIVNAGNNVVFNGFTQLNGTVSAVNDIEIVTNGDVRNQFGAALYSGHDINIRENAWLDNNADVSAARNVLVAGSLNGNGRVIANRVNVTTTGALIANGTIVAANQVDVRGTIAADDIWTWETLDALTIDGNLNLRTGSTISVQDLHTTSPDAMPDSDFIHVTGTTTIADGVTIDVQNFFRTGTYTLISSGPNGALNGSTPTNITYRGDSFAGVKEGRLSNITPTTEIVNAKDLLLTLNATLENIGMVWDGATNNTWDLTTRNWSGTGTDDDGIYTDNHFVHGDAVTFNLNNGNGAVHTINIDGAQKTVADMIVSSDDNWTFSGGNINADFRQNIGTNLAGATGSLMKSGAGTATFDNNVNFRGGLALDGGAVTFNANAVFQQGAQVNSGRINIGSGGTAGAFDGNIQNRGVVAFNRLDDITYDDIISGSGRVVKAGRGTLTFTGDNSYTGDTNVNAGTLQIGNGGTTGDVAGDISINGNTLIYNRYNDVAIRYDQDIIGTGGTLIQQGYGTLVLEGNTTNVNVIVANGVLGGTGSISGGSLTVNNGATLSPGYSPGTLTVNGDVVFESGSVYLYEVFTDENWADGLVATGTVTINNGAILDIELNGSGQRNQYFKVIDADIFSDGQRFVHNEQEAEDVKLFTIRGKWGMDFDHGITTYGANDIGYYIWWDAVAPEFANNLRAYTNVTPNALNVATGIDAMVNSYIQNFGVDSIDDLYAIDLYEALAGMNTDNPQDLADAYAQLHGEVFAANKEAAAQLQRSFYKLMPTGREIVKLNDITKLTNRWGTFTGGLQARNDINQYSGYDLLSTGFAIGIDRTVTPNVLLGVALGYDYASQDFDSIRSKSQMDAIRTMVYGSWFNGTSFIDAYGGYTKNFYENDRDINFNNYVATARSKYNDDMGSVGVTVGKSVWLGNNMITPSIGFHYLHMSGPDVVETGAGTANLHVVNDQYQSLRMPIGIKASQTFSEKFGLVWTPEVRLYYVREWMDDSVRVQTQFDGLQGIQFDADSGKWGRDSGRAGVGVNAQMAHRLNLRLDYDFEFYKYTSANILSATLGANW